MGSTKFIYSWFTRSHVLTTCCFVPTQVCRRCVENGVPLSITFNNMSSKCQLTRAFLIPSPTQMLLLLDFKLDDANITLALQGPLTVIVEYNSYLLQKCYCCIILTIYIFHLEQCLLDNLSIRGAFGIFSKSYIKCKASLIK